MFYKNGKQRRAMNYLIGEYFDSLNFYWSCFSSVIIFVTYQKLQYFLPTKVFIDGWHLSPKDTGITKFLNKISFFTFWSYPISKGIHKMKLSAALNRETLAWLGQLKIFSYLACVEVQITQKCHDFKGSCIC